MSFIGRNPNVDWINLVPRSADPTSPNEGDVYRSDGTVRPEGIWEYRDATWQQIGSASDISNYIAAYNSNFEGSIGDWVTYADAAGTSPVDGTGGSANITLTRTTTSSEVLNGIASAKLSKDAVNRQGEGVSLNVTLDNSLKGKPVEISFNYSATSNFVYGSVDGVTPSDIQVFLYDVTNAALIPVFPNTLDGTGIFKGQFQAASNSTSYRLILHIRSTSALAYDLFFDNVAVRRVEAAFIQADTDWIAYTPTFTGFGVVSNLSARYRKQGPNLELEIKVTSGTPTAVEAQMTLPSGLVSSSSIPTIQTAAWISYNNNSANQKNALIETSKAYLTFGSQGASVQGLVKQTGSNFIDASSTISFTASVPIQGWTSGATAVGTALQSVPVTFRAIKNGGSLTGGATIPSWTTVQKDSVGGFNATSGEYTVRIPGDYQVFVHAGYTSASTAAIEIFVNGTKYQDGTFASADFKFATGTIITNLQVGDIITLRPSSNLTLATSTTVTSWAMAKINDPSAFLTINRSTTKVLTTDITASSTDITELKFNNLIIGKKYKVELNPRVNVQSTSSGMYLYATHNGTEIARAGMGWSSATAATTTGHVSTSVEFTATASTVVFGAQEIGTGVIQGNGTTQFTSVTLTELNNTVEGNF